MKFSFSGISENPVSLARKLGYRPIGSKRGELNCARPIYGAGYPRFHLFIEKHQDKLVFKLHLDQKKPSYQGSSAHSGEYEGKVVENEAERIKNILQDVS